MLASDETIITINQYEVVLRPTLRAAMRLERKYDGFDKIIKAIADENLTVISSIIHECSATPTSAKHIIEELTYSPLNSSLGLLAAPLINLVFALAGYEPDAEPEPQDPAKRISFREHHERLFQIATGWLGWTPEVAWNATPNEIVAAYKGRCEMLKAVYGGEEQERAKPDLATQARLAFAKFPTKRVAADGQDHAG